MQALAALALECDVPVAEDGHDELVHTGLLEPTALAGLAVEGRGTFDRVP